MTITEIAAWVGAVAGVGGLVWQFVTWRRSPHRVTLALSNSWLTDGYGNLGDDPIGIEVRNTGSGPVSITRWAIGLPGDKNMFITRPVPGSVQLPHRLEPGDSANLFALSDDMRRHHAEHKTPFNRMRPWVGLGTGEKITYRKGLPLAD